MLSRKQIWDVRYLKSCYTVGRQPRVHPLLLQTLTRLLSDSQVEIQAAATANRQVVLDGDRLLDLTGEALFSREWRLM